MRFRSTIVLLAVFALLGGYVYFSEFRGQEERQRKEEAAKKALSFEAKDISEISLSYDGNEITGVRKGEGKWEITKPAGVEADPVEWDAVAANIVDIEKQEVVTADPTDLAPFGLDKPALKITLKRSGDQTTEIAFGAENPRKTLNYARVSGVNDVFLSPTKSATFRKTLTDLRNKNVMDFDPEDVDSIKIVDAGKEMTFQKSGENWLLKKPLEARADGSEVTTLLSAIRYARAADFADPSLDPKQAGLAPPASEVTSHDVKAGVDRVLLIGKKLEGDKYYVKDAARSVIMIVDKEIPEKLRRPLLSWRDKAVTEINKDGIDKIDEIEIVRGGEKISLKKNGADWQFPDGRKAQAGKIPGMMDALGFEKALDIIDTPKPAAAYGLDKPRIEVTARQAGQETLRLALGADSKNPDGVYLRTSARPTVFVVSKDLYSGFNVKTEDIVETSPANQ